MARTETGWLRWRGEVLILEVRVQPRASRNRVVGEHGGRLKVQVTAPPVDGAANDQLRALLAREFRVPASSVSLRAGAAGRDKRVEIVAPSALPGWLPSRPGTP